MVSYFQPSYFQPKLLVLIIRILGIVVGFDDDLTQKLPDIAGDFTGDFTGDISIKISIKSAHTALAVKACLLGGKTATLNAQ